MYSELVIALKERRIRSGVTIKALSAKSGINYRALRDVEQLKRDLKMGEYRAIIRALGITDLDVSLDMMGVNDMDEGEVVAILRLLSPQGRKLLIEFIASEYKKPVN
ncbi:helix-turn-helix domain-containing protein [Enterovibrio sp. 27052020O]|uniref:helix-turn-helix domain-containing protein n=1 Tax=Enterovibrio sp. 27052020O TaxID=3241166 RepID=UPI00388EDBFA